MKATLKLIAAAAVLASAGAANAAYVDPFSGNSSLTFMLVDTNSASGNAGSFVADLGLFLDDVAPSALYAGNGTTIQWNFNNNTLSINGVQQGGSYQWSTQFANYTSSMQLGESVWAVAGADYNNIRNFTTGNPTTAQLNAQNQGQTANMGNAFTVWSNNYDKGTITSTGSVVGANTVIGTSESSGYAAAPGNFGANLDWQGNLSWSAAVSGTTSNVYWLVDSVNTVSQMTNSTGVANTFSFQNGVLTYTVAAVPEGDGLALAMAGLGLLGFVARRRQAR